jgi:hypothetical protein
VEYGLKVAVPPNGPLDDACASDSGSADVKPKRDDVSITDRLRWKRVGCQIRQQSDKTSRVWQCVSAQKPRDTVPLSAWLVSPLRQTWTRMAGKGCSSHVPHFSSPHTRWRWCCSRHGGPRSEVAAELSTCVTMVESVSLGLPHEPT